MNICGILSDLLKRLSKAIPPFDIRQSTFVISCSFTRAAASGPKTASLIGKETIKKRISNIEQGITNVEGMYSIYFKSTERSESIIRHSTFQCSFTREVSGSSIRAH